MIKFFLLIFILPIICFSQTSYIDSLSNATYNHPNSNDSIQMHNYVLLVRAYITNKTTDSILPISNKAIEFAKKKNNPEYLTNAYNLQGLYYKINKQYKKALEVFNIGKYYSSQINQPIRIQSVIYYNLATTHNLLGNGDSSLIYAEKSYKIALEIKNSKYQSLSLNSIAQYFISVGNFPVALDYLNKSLKLAIEIQDTNNIIVAKINIGKVLFDSEKYQEMITIYNSLMTDYDSTSVSPYNDIINLNVGAAYSELNKNDKSLEFTYKLLSSENEICRGLASSNIAEIYLNMLKDNVPVKDIPLIKTIKLEPNEIENKPKILELVLDYLNHSIEDFNSVDAENYIVHPLINTGEYYEYIGKNKSAINSYNKAWKLAENNQLLNEQRIIAEKLYLVNKKKKNLKETLKWHEKYIEIKDSLNSKENQQEIGKQMAQFEFTNIRLKDSLEQIKKDEIQQIKIAQQKKNIENEQFKKYYLYGGLVIASLLLIILFRRFNLTKKQKHLIELQKAEMERKQIELSKTHLAIKDSINYSKKIQRAIFPSKEDVNAIFSDNFILFQPKDVVSGDFYWCSKVNNKKIFVLADCNGHGVPGAFMTIIGINILKEIIQEGVIDSSQILKEINSKLKNRLGQNEGKVKDGMDLAICVIDDATIEFSGAHFPLYHISDNLLVEYKGSNVFLGNEDEIDNIKTYYIPYKKGDLLYLATDGFPDQKGGIKSKKYFYKPFRELIHKNSSLPLSKQRDVLKTEFENWIAFDNKKQMDDVSIVGIKL